MARRKPWRTAPTLRARFAVWLVALLLAVLAAFGAFVYLRLARSAAVLIDDSLDLSAAQVVAAVDVDGGGIRFTDSVPESRDAADDARERGLTVRILDASGTIVQSFGAFKNLPGPPGVVAAALAHRATFATVPGGEDDDAVRVHTVPIEAGGAVVGVVQVAMSLGAVGDTLQALLAAMLIAIPALVIVAGLAGYALAGRALAPIDAITRTAQRISAEDLSTRLGLAASDDEVGRLAATFDAMLVRLDDAFKRERQFTADASHELRTPLAAMLAILGVIRRRRRSPEDYEAAMGDIADEANRLRRLTDDLLRLARADERLAARSDTRVDLSTLLADVADSLEPLATAKGLTLTRDIAPALAVNGSRDDVIRLFVNVLDNAIRFTDAGRVTVVAAAAAPHADGIVVTVADTGRGIAAEHVPHIFNRFYRVDPSRTAGGAGLGLAIAQAIAHQHGGAITVASVVGEGTRFEVRLPRAAVDR